MVTASPQHRIVVSNTVKVVGLSIILLAGLFTFAYVFQKTTVLEFDRFTGDMRQSVFVRGVRIDAQITPSGLAQEMATLGITQPSRQWQFLSRWNMMSRGCGGPSDFSAIRGLSTVLETYCTYTEPALKKTFLEKFLLHAQTSDEIDLDIQYDHRLIYLLANGQRIAELPMDY